MPELSFQVLSCGWERVSPAFCFSKRSWGKSGILEKCCLAQTEPPGQVPPAKWVVLSVEIVFGCFGCMDTGAFLIPPSISTESLSQEVGQFWNNCLAEGSGRDGKLGREGVLSGEVHICHLSHLTGNQKQLIAQERQNTFCKV